MVLFKLSVKSGVSSDFSLGASEFLPILCSIHRNEFSSSHCLLCCARAGLCLSNSAGCLLLRIVQLRVLDSNCARASSPAGKASPRHTLDWPVFNVSLFSHRIAASQPISGRDRQNLDLRVSCSDSVRHLMECDNANLESKATQDVKTLAVIHH